MLWLFIDLDFGRDFLRFGKGYVEGRDEGHQDEHQGQPTAQLRLKGCHNGII